MTPTRLITTAQQKTLDALLEDCRRQRWRRLVWLTGSHADCLATAAEIVQQIDPDTIWVSDLAPIGAASIGAHKAQSLLGREIPALVFDAHLRFDPDAIAAACGAVRAGGIALLLTPNAVEWPDGPDLDKARIAVHPYKPEQIGSRFVRRLILRLGQDRQVIRWVCDGEWKFTPTADPSVKSGADSVADSEAGGAEILTTDQQAAVEAVTGVVIGHRRRPAVLIADRGRGKSAAMGVAAANLLAVRCDRILVTAPRKSACDSLFKHAEITFANQGSRDDKLGSRLKYVTPDKLIEHPSECDLLLVDEAAGLPLTLLQKLLKQYSRIAFATTVHGYEGSGRGFLLRFTEHLDQHTPGWKRINLHQPIRYGENDPLEQTLFQSLLLNATIDPRPIPEQLDDEAPNVERINRDHLVHDETLLRDIYGLLVMAHYRTRPLDLRQLLDGPNVRVWTVTWHERIVATALVCREGDFTTSLTAKIFAGERRPRGHLLAQTLIGHLGIDNAAAMEGERIMRIVVHPQWQNLGLGQTLVTHISAAAKAEGLQWCGASFGATPRLLRFWGRCEMQPIYIGNRREASSGAHSVMVLCGLDEVGDQLMADAVTRFKTSLPHWLAEQLRTLEAPIVSEIYRQLAADSYDDGLDDNLDDTGDLAPAEFLPASRITNPEWKAFARQQRGYDESAPTLVTEFMVALANGQATHLLDPQELQLLIMKLLQKRSWRAVASASGLSGRDLVVRALRRACRKLSST